MFMGRRNSVNHRVEGVIANAILNGPNAHPNGHKRMGRMVRNFNVAVWDRECVRIVAVGNFEKFSQHERLRDRLVGERDRGGQPDRLYLGDRYERDRQRELVRREQAGQDVDDGQMAHGARSIG
ncbi:hypothetical protein BJ875DRAFT_451336 [Amylocarpus encephaloides]|uniref:NADAR domain-containing protein n=1 Tax=Amylocarpus encephaloides TaxID=45428 RepID=A0A9P7YSD2_9HELO|nr:hypothetical protein BJ875DRAFT_451336 [Amylocarpus encephaloides]